MTISLIEIGDHLTRLGLFKDNRLLGAIKFLTNDLENQIFARIDPARIEKCIIISNQEFLLHKAKAILSKIKIPIETLSKADLAPSFFSEESSNIDIIRFACAYGALKHFPLSDCLVIRLGSTVTFDFVTKEGNFSLAATYPFPLGTQESKENFIIKKPDSSDRKSEEESLEFGKYYGLLGAIERISAEVSLENFSPSSVKIVLTADTSLVDYIDEKRDNAEFFIDLKDLVDHIDPDLSLIGFYEIYKEHTHKQ